MAQQISQHVENLRLQVDDLAAAPQLDALDAQLAITDRTPTCDMVHRGPHDAQIVRSGCRERQGVSTSMVTGILLVMT